MVAFLFQRYENCQFLSRELHLKCSVSHTRLVAALTDGMDPEHFVTEGSPVRWHKSPLSGKRKWPRRPVFAEDSSSALWMLGLSGA